MFDHRINAGQQLCQFEKFIPAYIEMKGIFFIITAITLNDTWGLWETGIRFYL